MPIVVRMPDWGEPILHPATWKSVDGGRSKGASHLFSQAAVLRASGRNPFYKPRSVRIASARNFKTTIKQSVKVAVESYIRLWKLGDEFRIFENEIWHRPTDSLIFFPGVTRDPDSFLSMENIDVFWMEQAEGLGDEMEKVIPTIVRTVGSELWFSWNARKRQQWCWQRFKTDRRRASDIVISKTFEDNPWMFPRCESVTCQTPSPWDTADQPCEVCGGPKWPGVPDFMEEVYGQCRRDEPERYAHVYGGQPDDGDAARQVLTYAMVKACVEAFQAGTCA